MKIAVDTNIIIRCIQLHHPQSQEALQSTTELLHRKHELCWFPQHHYEFWVVATRPKHNNGFGMTIQQTMVELANLHSRLTFHDDLPHLYNTWIQLVTTHGVLGKTAHDARIVAAMMNHGITHLLTFNVNDFQRYSGIIVISPADVLASPLVP